MPRAPQIPEAAWDNHRERLQELRSSGMPLKDIILKMQHDHQFFATESQYKKKFTEWGFAKTNAKNPRQLWQAVDFHIRKRKRENKDSRVIVGDQVIDAKKVCKEISRYPLSAKEMSLKQATFELPSNALVNTPSPLPDIQVLPARLLRAVTHRTLPWIFFDNVTLQNGHLPFHLQPQASGIKKPPTGSVIDILEVEDSAMLTNAISTISHNDTNVFEVGPAEVFTDDSYTVVDAATSSIQIPDDIPPGNISQQSLDQFPISNSAYSSYRRAVPIFRQAVYHASNNLMDHKKLKVLLEWTIDNHLFWVIERLAGRKSSTVVAFASQLLCSALEIGDPGVVKSLLSIGASANSPLSCCRHEGHPLEKAIHALRRASELEACTIQEWVSIAEALVIAGANVNCLGETTPLQTAVSCRSARLIRILLDAGADVDAPATEYDHDLIIGLLYSNMGMERLQDIDIRTPIQIAYSIGDTGIMQLLLDYGANMHACVSQTILEEDSELSENAVELEFCGTMLAIAAEKGDFPLAAKLLDEGAHPLSYESRSPYHKCPLERAVARNDVGLTILLLGYLSGASSVKITHSVTPTGSSCNESQITFAEAALQKNVDALKLLPGLTALSGVNDSIKNRALRSAICSDSVGTYKLLVNDIGWAVSQATINSAIREMSTIGSSGNSVFQRVLEVKSDINEADEDGNTSLSTACSVVDVDLVQLLSSNGADASVPNKRFPFHLSPFSAALAADVDLDTECNLDKILELLMSTGVPLNGDALGAAAQTGNVALVKSVLSTKVDPDGLVGNCKGRKSPCCYEPTTPLHVALMHKNDDVVGSLLEAGANPDVTLDCGCTPLGFALTRLVTSDHPSHMWLLNTILAYGASPNKPFHIHRCQCNDWDDCDWSDNDSASLMRRLGISTSYSRLTPLTFLAIHGSFEATRAAHLLLELGAKPHFEGGISSICPLQASTAYGSSTMLSLLLHNLEADMGCPYSHIGEAYAGDANFPSAVELAFLSDSNHKLEALETSCGPLSSIKDSFWLSVALERAAGRWDVKRVEQLLRLGVDPNESPQAAAKLPFLLGRLRKCQASQTPLQLVSIESCPDDWGKMHDHENDILTIAEALLDAGANVDHVLGDSGPYWHWTVCGTPLALAVKSGFDELTELYLARGANVNPPLRDVRRWMTPLQAAAKGDNIELMKRLLAEGADVNADPAREAGATALQWATIRGNLKIAELLLQNGANIAAAGSEVEGRTALEGAAQHGRLDMAHLLLENIDPVDKEVIKEQCITAAEYAEKEGHMVIAKLLRDWEAEN